MIIGKKSGNKACFLVLSLALLLQLSSCYSVRMVNTRGIPQPDPLNTSKGFYRGKLVHKLDTVISLKVIQNEFTLLEKCSEGGFYSLEYRVTLGAVLLSGVTLGKKRKVMIRYVCLKESN
ncbi:MAG: hypothetical protein WDO19_29700 [Bacteroidota bacterium]